MPRVRALPLYPRPRPLGFRTPHPHTVAHSYAHAHAHTPGWLPAHAVWMAGAGAVWVGVGWEGSLRERVAGRAPVPVFAFLWRAVLCTLRARFLR